MTPQERLEGIKNFYLQAYGEATSGNILWLIDRVEKLEKALEHYRYCAEPNSDIACNVLDEI